MNQLLAGMGLIVLAVAFILFFVLRSKTPTLPMDRRRMPGMSKVLKPSQLSRITGITTEAISEFLEQRGWTKKVTAALDLAGMRVSPADFMIFVVAGGAVAAVFGLVLGGTGLAILLFLLSPLGAKLVISFLTARRRSKFADQLDNTLQLFAGSLRAGHSLLHAVDAVAKESEAPTSEELARVVAETRLGKDLDEALLSTAERMDSKDTTWVAQAIGVQREVGGNLADVLDKVAFTIRERNQIKRQIASLSAEGKMSAYILMALPFVILIALQFLSPSYIQPLFTSGIFGYGLMGIALVMFAMGGFWMRKIVVFKF